MFCFFVSSKLIQIICTDGNNLFHMKQLKEIDCQCSNGNQLDLAQHLLSPLFHSFDHHENNLHQSQNHSSQHLAFFIQCIKIYDLEHRHNGRLQSKQIKKDPPSWLQPLSFCPVTKRCCPSVSDPKPLASLWPDVKTYSLFCRKYLQLSAVSCLSSCRCQITLIS